jgi:hypothetical protein
MINPQINDEIQTGKFTPNQVFNTLLKAAPQTFACTPNQPKVEIPKIKEINIRDPLKPNDGTAALTVGLPKSAACIP